MFHAARGSGALLVEAHVMPSTLRRAAAALCVSLAIAPARAFAQANVTTEHNDAARRSRSGRRADAFAAPPLLRWPRMALM
jgi:hypothetical protein